jgi:hypothetical protein
MVDEYKRHRRPIRRFIVEPPGLRDKPECYTTSSAHGGGVFDVKLRTSGQATWDSTIERTIACGPAAAAGP